MTDEEFKELEEKYNAELDRRKVKIRLEIMSRDLEFAKDEGGGYDRYGNICRCLTSEELEKLYLFLKNMFEEELKELNKDEKI